MNLNEMIEMRNDAKKLFLKNEGESTEMRQLHRLINELNSKILKETNMTKIILEADSPKKIEKVLSNFRDSGIDYKEI